jgi:hypothetical protein
MKEMRQDEYLIEKRERGTTTNKKMLWEQGVFFVESLSLYVLVVNRR